jgi:hypothetical protein
MAATPQIFELEPKGLTDLDLFLCVSFLAINNVEYDIKDTEVDETPGEGVHVDVVAFLDPETAKKADAALITIEPNKSTPIQHFTGPRVFIDAVDTGSGTWIGLSPEGKLVTYQFEDESERKAVVYGAGWTGTWVAGEYGLKVIEVCIPPFENTGIEVLPLYKESAENGVAVPHTFWATYLRVLGQEE